MGTGEFLKRQTLFCCLNRYLALNSVRRRRNWLNLTSDDDIPNIKQKLDDP